MIRHHLPAPTPEQKRMRSMAYWLLVMLACVALSFLGGCSSAKVARVRPPRGPLLGLRDIESPAPRNGWQPSDAGLAQ
jgi:hypothetical protein